ncbi:MAG: hypothetical protein SFW62_05505 [Alphaproteobacteria bacterium]|nr:hypothetical protein [Alphaproteobacteria bacterium]
MKRAWKNKFAALAAYAVTSTPLAFASDLSQASAPQAFQASAEQPGSDNLYTCGLEQTNVPDSEMMFLIKYYSGGCLSKLLLSSKPPIKYDTPDKQGRTVGVESMRRISIKGRCFAEADLSNLVPEIGGFVRDGNESYTWYKDTPKRNFARMCRIMIAPHPK